MNEKENTRINQEKEEKVKLEDIDDLIFRNEPVKLHSER